jgi:hypothetical protein
MLTYWKTTDLPTLTSEEAAEAAAQSTPEERGFWLDEEVLQSSGLGSASILQKAQTFGLIQPGYLPRPGGGRRRAWSFQNVALAETLARFSRHTGISLISSARLLARVSPRWIVAALHVDHKIDGQGVLGRTAPSRLIIRPPYEVWREQGGDLTDPTFRSVVEHEDIFDLSPSSVAPGSETKASQLLKAGSFHILADFAKLELTTANDVRQAFFAKRLFDQEQPR